MSSVMIKRIVIAGFLILAGMWSLASAPRVDAYADPGLLAGPKWLQQHKDDPGVAVVDVREDKYFDGKVIPGAVRMPWRSFRKNDLLYGLGGVFVGLDEAQSILGEHGIARSDTVVLYDSVERDGGATASYVFWVLDLLGHDDVKILERGIDGWREAGYELSDNPAKQEPVLYQAPVDEVQVQRRISGEKIYQRLNDPHYQIIDVRSRSEYLGERPNTGLDGTVLKLGHIPTAYNVNYTHNWTSEETKDIKPAAELAQMYAGMDRSKGTVVYCHSGRRGSFGYFILRLMGFQDVRLYENSWFEWGSHENFFPVETKENLPPSGAPISMTPMKKTSSSGKTGSRGGSGSSGGSSGSGDGYVSCGG
ncbi:sulfurtransferase [Desulfovibrio oxyclinae]|uniref:sulfurtransferase n=1 Tax=Desulfovibrio oxyclinae TaxID=63560 RepID=UPI00037F262F|nr:sulfurtransferase [Desulfovibrio oxyclinae]